jgi:hypothetical protein
MISFSCDVCTEPCAGDGAARRPCVLIERAAMLLISNGRWVKGITIMGWDDAAAGTGRYHHVHADKCLPTWISRNAQGALQNALEAVATYSGKPDQLPLASEGYEKTLQDAWPKGTPRRDRGRGAASRPRSAALALD